MIAVRSFDARNAMKLESEQKEEKMGYRYWNTFFGRKTTLILVGLWAFGALALPVNYLKAQDKASENIAQATKQVAETRDLAVAWIDRARGTAEAYDIREDSFETIEAIACFIAEAKAKFDAVNSAVNSIKIVSLPATEKGGTARQAVRALYCDGSVKYYDADALDGTTAPKSEPDAASVEAAPEHVVGLDAFYAKYAKRFEEKLRAQAIERCVAKGGDPSGTGFLFAFESLKPSVIRPTKAENEREILKSACGQYAYAAREYKYDAETTAMFMAARINHERVQITKRMSPTAFTEIKSVKIVPFCVVEPVENEKFVRASIFYAVRVVYSDDVVKYYENGTYGKDANGLYDVLDDLKKIPGYTPVVANEEDLPEFELTLDDFNKLKSENKSVPLEISEPMK